MKTTLAPSVSIPIKRFHLDLEPNPEMVVARFFNNGEERSREMIRTLLQLDMKSAHEYWEVVQSKYKHRHRNFISNIQENYKYIRYLAEEEAEGLGVAKPIPFEMQNLIGTFFTKEYSIAAGALFNPSIIPSPEQKTDDPNRLDFVLSLRATGEGHISSIVFRTGHYLSDDKSIHLDKPSLPIKVPTQQRLFNYDKDSFNQKLKSMGVNAYFRNSFIGCIENHIFSYQDFQLALKKFEKKKESLDERDEKFWFNKIKWLAESHLELQYRDTNEISERVIFPIAEHERNGIEDARFVKFSDSGKSTYYATYTAYDGRVILPKLIHTKNFQNFDILPLRGRKVLGKNFALFPRKIRGQYAMLSRLDGYNHFMMYSSNIYQWDHAEKIEVKKHLWEMVQVGNCGSPLETPHGWLVINHGVGPMREYCLGAMLLDLENPARVLAQLPYPLMTPQENEREGYVPNVLYSCGSLIFKDDLILPYACSDTRISCATLSVSLLIDELKRHSI